MTFTKKTIGYIFMSVCFFLSSCKKPEKMISTETYRMLNGLCGSKGSDNLIVYYFDGDCAICLGKANYLAKKYIGKENFKPILIAKTLNPDVLHYNLNLIHFKSCLYIDKSDKFDKLLPFDTVLLVKNDYSTIKLTNNF